jgi:hypothetical protein
MYKFNFKNFRGEKLIERRIALTNSLEERENGLYF